MNQMKTECYILTPSPHLWQTLNILAASIPHIFFRWGINDELYISAPEVWFGNIESILSQFC